jgi:hypothetical protein
VLTPKQEVAALLAGFVAVNSLMLGFALWVFRPGAAGYFAYRGRAVGWLAIIALNCAFAVSAILELPRVCDSVLWWWVALTFFGLTVRQTLKMNVLMVLLYIAIVFGIAAAIPR